LSLGENGGHATFQEHSKPLSKDELQQMSPRMSTHRDSAKVLLKTIETENDLVKNEEPVSFISISKSNFVEKMLTVSFSDSKNPRLIQSPILVSFLTTLMGSDKLFYSFNDAINEDKLINNFNEWWKTQSGELLNDLTLEGEIIWTENGIQKIDSNKPFWKTEETEALDDLTSRFNKLKADQQKFKVKQQHVIDLVNDISEQLKKD
jgi:hypothetical protein